MWDEIRHAVLRHVINEDNVFTFYIRCITYSLPGGAKTLGKTRRWRIRTLLDTLNGKTYHNL